MSYKTTLDTASEGNFVTRSPEDARRLIENVATGKSYEKKVEEIGNSINSEDNSDLVEIKNSLNSLHSFLQNQHRSDKAQIENDALSDMKNQLEEETSYSDPYPVFNIDSFTQAYDIAVKSRTGKEKFNIRQAVTGNRKTKSDF